MERRELRVILTLIMTLCLGFSMVSAAEEVSSMTCDGGVIDTSDTRSSVEDKCGEPDKREGNSWRYEFGPSQPVYTVVFGERENVIRIIEEQWGN
jgi:hypothetical protein